MAKAVLRRWQLDGQPSDWGEYLIGSPQLGTWKDFWFDLKNWETERRLYEPLANLVNRRRMINEDE